MSRPLCGTWTSASPLVSSGEHDRQPLERHDNRPHPLESPPATRLADQRANFGRHRYRLPCPTGDGLRQSIIYRFGCRFEWGGSTNAQSTSSQRALAFTSCMRSQGVSKYPDPSSSGELPKVSVEEFGVSSSKFEAAKTACAHLLPNGAQPTEAASPQVLGKLVNFAGCMRSHGVSNWPDPIPVSAQAPPGAPPFNFDLHGLPGLDGRSFSPQINTTMSKCFHLTRLTDAEVPWSS
jgi:hypothetical protein